MDIQKKLYPEDVESRPKNFINKLLENPWYKNIAILQSNMSFATHNFFTGKGMLASLVPITTNSISSPMGLGSDSKPCKVILNEKSIYLADSLQFFLEVSLRLNDKGAYYLMPSFRNDKLDERHLTQFYHIESEIYGNLESVINLVEEFIYSLVSNLYENSRNLIFDITSDLNHVEELIMKKGKFPRITFAEAIRILNKYSNCIGNTSEGFKFITNNGEKKLIDLFDGFVWLTHLPWNLVPFYQQPDKNSVNSLTADLLFGIGEVVGAGQRISNSNDLLNSLRYHEISPTDYEWYIDLKKISPGVTSGFGMGIERFFTWMLKLDDVRQFQLFLRDIDREYLP